MRYDYTKSKSYQKIVSKAKKYSSQGSTSLKAQRKRMQERRADFGYLKDQGVIETTKAGTKVLKEVKESGYSGAKKVLSTYTPEQRDAIGVIVKRRGTLLQKIGFDSIQKELMDNNDTAYNNKRKKRNTASILRRSFLQKA